ncbi:acetyl-CoA carboxylase biotin carboxylase subunit [Roseiterribacter gracilis]|uniref:Biotin carboxylase subunit of acetyl-CoA carboxylase n=1 Tax=Roseiterribacter gracilis TaxID=2812848 RepID=A0A8S8XH48_9PROT|nr:biotin carboxylase subunit of acetyl-CoA carboxylase [Rhodospirillales bacterium TMPK1]
MLKTLLIANRGEIAVRIARTARKLGVRTVAVYSDADRHAAHVVACDEAVRIGPPAARDSYLKVDAILEAARATGADAIHPGYGFLSERADFAEACETSGIIFVGPPASAIRAMGSKSEAKTLMQAANVPLVPGYHGAAQDLETLRKASAKIGYPVLLKAAMGGGGKGIRIVEREEDLAQSIELVTREAIAAFGDGTLLVEKYVTRPRHVEVQVFADKHGNFVHLFERDCTLQRRHQKVIEEAPAPNLSADARKTLHASAIAAAKAIGYVGAGTVEFLLGADGAVYFMEMNTRLQVEHPVTEYVTGFDLVEWQLRVASGETLPRTQDQIHAQGHAVEARLYAEDPSRDFMPSTGKLTRLSMPDDIRIDSGVREGDTITSYYDPMIAKLIAGAATREEAFAKLANALDETAVDGVRTNAAFLAALARDPAVAAMQIDTSWIERRESSAAVAADPSLAALAALYTRSTRPTGNDPWDVTDGFRVNLPAEDVIALDIDGTTRRFGVTRDAQSLRIDGHLVNLIDLSNGAIAAEIDGRLRRATVSLRDGGIALFANGASLVATVPDPLVTVQAGGASGDLKAPMPGTVVAIEVEAGAKVTAGTTLLILEAMKVHLPIHAPTDGTVGELFVALGDQVMEGAPLAHIDPA